MTDEKELKKQDEAIDDPKQDSLDDSSIEAEFLEKLPPEARKVVEIGMSMQRIGPMQNPIMGKINEEHIDKILEISAKDDERSFLDAKESRKYTLFYVGIFAAVFIFLTVFLVGSNTEVYRELIKLIAVFFGGFGGGFGVKSYIDRNK